MAFLIGPNACFMSRLFPPHDEGEWEKGHGRIDRRRLIARVAVTPEEIGLCGCWQVLALRRERIELGRKAGEPSDEISYYATSIGSQEMEKKELLQVIRDHWGACENGAHYRRDVSFGEDACRVSKRSSAQVLSTLRNLALGLYELQKERGKTKAATLPSWRRTVGVSTALKLILRT